MKKNINFKIILNNLINCVQLLMDILVLDLLSTLLGINEKNSAAICVFCYNVMKNIACDLDEKLGITAKSINSLKNYNATVSGYIVDRELYDLSQEMIRLQSTIKINDFGITILMIHFAQYYARGQYPLFVNQFRCVRELEIIEKFLLSYNQKHIKLPINMATHKEFGLLANREKFTSTNAITCATFDFINVAMRNPNITPKEFIKLISPMHIQIIESFYIFTSITKNCKIIQECHELMYKCLNYTFVKPIKHTEYNGNYWFILPPHSIWFAYHQGRVKVSYISTDIYNAMHIFDKLNYVVVGFIYDNQIYPIIFEDPRIIGDWDKNLEVLLNNKFNCVFQCGTPPKSSHVYFVKNQHFNIFKLI